MKTIIIVILASFSLLSSNNTNVYICKGPYSKKYHYAKNCRGLKNCSTDVYRVSLAEAQSLGRSLCGWED